MPIHIHERGPTIAFSTGLAAILLSASIPATSALAFPQWLGTLQVAGTIVAALLAIGLGIWVYRTRDDDAGRTRARWAIVLGAVPLVLGAVAIVVVTLLLRPIV